MALQQHAQQPLEPGTRLDSYTITGVLGTGGFGVTYDARDEDLDRRVAIKEYFPESFAARQADGTTLVARNQGVVEDYEWGLTRFLDEARTLARFRDPHIVQVNRYLTANQTAYLVMDFEDGYPLSEVLKRRRIGESSVIKLAVPLLKGLEVIHDQSFLHRDIKPGNVFIRRSGPPLLIDFGAARQALQKKAAQAMTVILTPGYAPLEQYGEGDDSQGPWTDIYALGATLFHSLTGRAPRDAAWRIQAAHHERPDPVHEALHQDPPVAGPGLVELLIWMLEPFAKHRPQDCQEVLEAIAALPEAAGGETMGRTVARRGPAGADPSAVATRVIAPGAAARPGRRSSSGRASGGAAPRSEERPTGGISAEDLSAAQILLADHLGPIAKVLIKKAAGVTDDRDTFAHALADEIDDPDARDRFLAAFGRR